jgi:hypothetical protein
MSALIRVSFAVLVWAGDAFATPLSMLRLGEKRWKDIANVWYQICEMGCLVVDSM